MMIEAIPLALPDVKLVRYVPHADARGALVETFSAPRFAAAGLPSQWAQDNEVRTGAAGTVRGLHFQAYPHAQAKLVRVVSGRIFDVAVDVRPGSADFGRHVAVVLNSDRHEGLFIPEGFAHGNCTMRQDSIVHYKMTHAYTPAAERALLWCDPALALAWPVAESALVAVRDRAAPSLAELFGAS